MQMTTREAVELAIGEMAAQCEVFEKDCVRCMACELLCEHYGFKIEQFFDVKEPA